MHTYTNTHTQKNMHAHTHTEIHMHMCTHTPIHAVKNMHAHTNTHTETHMYVCTHAQIHTLTNTTRQAHTPYILPWLNISCALWHENTRYIYNTCGLDLVQGMLRQWWMPPDSQDNREGWVLLIAVRHLFGLESSRFSVHLPSVPEGPENAYGVLWKSQKICPVSLVTSAPQMRWEV